MTTHTSYSHQIPRQNKTKSKLQIFNKFQKCKFLKFCKKIYTRHTFWSCLIRCININEMDPTRTVGSAERTRDAGRTCVHTYGQTDGRTEWDQYTPQQLRCVWGIINFKKKYIKLDESTARRQLKSPQSLSGRSIPLVTFEVWSSINMFDFRFVAIGPFLAEI